jgi:Na+-driven multidrug efflux pump
LQYAISIISWEFFFILVSHDGTMALDISQMMRLLFGFFGIFIWAFAATSNTMVSNIIGQGHSNQVPLLLKRIISLSAGSTLLLFIPTQLFPEQIISMFNGNPIYIAMAVPVLRIVSSGILIMSISAVCLNGVTGTGNTRVNLMIEMATIIMYCIYIYLVLEVYDLSITWGWGSELLYWTSILIMSAGYLLSGRWDNIKSRQI